MTFRTTAIAAVLTLLGLAAQNPLSAQPLVPSRGPPNASFGGLFYPGSPAMPNVTGVYGINRLGAGGGPVGGGNFVGPGGVGGPGSYGPWSTYVLNMQPVVFNNRGHWYANYYSHWYPNGLRSGVGVLSNGGSGFRTGGYGYAGGAGLGLPGGTFPGGTGAMPGGLGGGGMGGGGMPAIGVIGR